MAEIPHRGFDTMALLDREQPLPNDDPRLKEWIETNGSLYINKAVIGVREAIPGEQIETWVNGAQGKVLERSEIAKEGNLVAVGVLGEQYIPSAESLQRNKIPVGEEGLRDDEVAPPLPNDGHQYHLWRTNGGDYRVVAANPLPSNIYLLTSSGRLQTGVPGGLIAAQIRSSEDDPTQHVVDVARFIAPDEFAASYRPATPIEYAQFGMGPT